jgi:hypothetical protein
VSLTLLWTHRATVVAQLSAFLHQHPDHAGARALRHVVAPCCVDVDVVRAARAARVFFDIDEVNADDRDVDDNRAAVDAFFDDAAAHNVAIAGVVVDVGDTGCVVDVGPGRVVVSPPLRLGQHVAVRVQKAMRTTGPRLVATVVDPATTVVRVAPQGRLTKHTIPPHVLHAVLFAPRGSIDRTCLLQSRFGEHAWNVWFDTEPAAALAWALSVDGPAPVGAQAVRLRERHRHRGHTPASELAAALRSREPQLVRAACGLIAHRLHPGLADVLHACANNVVDDGCDVDIAARGALLQGTSFAGVAPLVRRAREQLEQIAIDDPNVRRRCRAAAAWARARFEFENERPVRFFDVDAAAAARVVRGDVDAVTADVLAGAVDAHAFVDAVE